MPRVLTTVLLLVLSGCFSPGDAVTDHESLRAGIAGNEGPIRLHELKLANTCSPSGATTADPSATGESGELAQAAQQMQELNASFNLQIFKWVVDVMRQDPDAAFWQATLDSYRTFHLLAHSTERTELGGRFRVELTGLPSTDCGMQCEPVTILMAGSFDRYMSMISSGSGFVRWTDNVVEANGVVTGDGVGFHRGCDRFTGIAFERTRIDYAGSEYVTFECHHGGEVVACGNTNFWPFD